MAATVFLIFSTVGMVSAAYVYYNDLAEEAEANPDLEIERLNVEGCYRNNLKTSFAVRNANLNPINTSRIGLEVNNNRVENYNVSPEIVNPRQTFHVEAPSTVNVSEGDKVIFRYGGGEFPSFCREIKGSTIYRAFYEGGDYVDRLILNGNLTPRKNNLCLGDKCAVDQGNRPTSVFDIDNDYLNVRGDRVNGTLTTQKMFITSNVCIGDGCGFSSGSDTGFIDNETSQINGSLSADSLKTDQMCVGSGC